MNKELIGVFFTNGMYLSQIQCGIQTAHCVTKMFVKYPSGAEREILEDYGLNHMTKWVLNAGNNYSIKQISTILQNISFFIGPWTDFSEDMQSLNGATTCTGIIFNKHDFNLVPQNDVKSNLDELLQLSYDCYSKNIALFILKKLTTMYKFA